MKKVVVAALLTIIAVAVIANGGIHTGASPDRSRVRLVEHHCSRAGDGGVFVDAQLANDGPTGVVKAEGYILLRGGRVVTARDQDIGTGSPWQFDRTVPSHQSAIFEVEVAWTGRIAGCGVHVGAGAPQGVAYEGDGYGNG